MMNNKPMTDKRLQTILERSEQCYALHMETPDVSLDNVYPDLLHDYHCDIADLLDEVERQRAVIAEQQGQIRGWEQVAAEERTTREIAQAACGQALMAKSRLELQVEEQQVELAAMRLIVEAAAKLAAVLV